MRNLVKGIIEFRQGPLRDYRARYAHLAAGQSPDSLFFACADSRVVPNTFASTDPGDLFVVRSVGNLVPPPGGSDFSIGDESEVAAIEFAILELEVDDIVVCGHSGCGAMAALLGGRESIQLPHLRSWLRHGEPSLELARTHERLDPGLPMVDRVSQANVLVQLENVARYSIVRERLERGELRMHGFWFDLATADVHYFDPEWGRFVVLDEAYAPRILARLGERIV
jgi:carbonic anhydrase